MRRVFIALLLVTVLVDAAPRVKPRTARHAKKKKPAAPAFDIAAVNDPATQRPLKLHNSGSATLRAQILLDRAHFAVGEIDGSYGTTMLDTVKAYQASHNLPPDGIVSPDMWKSLNNDTLPAVVPYTIADTDAAGPFTEIPEDMLEKSKLPALGFTSPLEALGERYHASPKLLQVLNPGKQLDKAGEQIMVPNVERTPITDQADRVEVKKSCSCLEVFNKQDLLMAHYPATMGSEHDPLPLGDWKISKPLWNPVFHYNSELFWDADEKNTKANIKPGPNNPVGVVWIGLSKEHYGIHGTPEPSGIGKAQSHGCIRLTNWDASDVATMVHAGMIASLREN